MPSLRFLTLTSCLALVAAAPIPRPQHSVAIVTLNNFSFSPSAVELRAGVSTTMSLRNVTGSGHSFSAPALFASARLDPASAALVRHGRVEVPARSEVDIEFATARGQYRFQCTHMFHAMLGMTGTIIVR
jgi:plastocyanin